MKNDERSMTLGSIFVTKRIFVALCLTFLLAASSVFAAATISGQVTSTASGDPIAGATIELLKATTIMATTTTDGTGNYTFAGLTPDNYVARARAANYQSALTTLTVREGQSVTLDFSLLSHPGSVQGTVTDANTGLPLAGVIMEIKLNSGIISSDVTDNAGHYLMEGVPPGSYTVYAFRSNYQTVVVGMTLQVDQTLTIDFALPAQIGSILGFITDAITGLPIVGAVVEVRLNNSTVYTALSNALGKYKITGIIPGAYSVSAQAFGYQTGVIGSQVQPNVAATASMPLWPNPGTVFGVITSLDAGLPIANALVTAKLHNVVVSSIFTDTLGHYTINGLAPQRYTMSAYATTYQIGLAQARVQSEQMTQVDLALASAPGSLSGTVTRLDNGLPIANALVEVSLNHTTSYSTLTDNLGNYLISEIVPNTYSVSAHAATYQIATASVSISPEQVSEQDFALEQNVGSITATFFDVDTGVPISGVFVKLLQNDSMLATILTDTSGVGVIGNLGAGNYKLQASRSDYNSQITQVSLALGADITVEIDMIANNAMPRNLTATASDNHFLLKSERIYSIQWQASPSNCIAKYLIYRDGSLIATVNADQPLTYNDRRRTNGKMNTYTVVAVTTQGVESAPTSITVR